MTMILIAERVIYANPCKTRSFISHAKDQNVYKFILKRDPK